LNGFLNYHLQRQDSEKGGWADNIMIQALANTLERVIEVQLFDRVGNAIGADPVVIHPQHVANPNVLRLGNLDDLHFVVAAPPIAANYVGEEISLSVGNIQEEVNARMEDEGDPCEEEIDWDQYRCEDPGSTPTSAPTVIAEIPPTPNATSQVYYETFEFGDAASFELEATLLLSGVYSTVSNI
jgi:hypothetical protein